MEESTGGFGGGGGFRSASHTSHCSLSSPFAAASRRCPSLSFPAASGSARAARPSPPAYQGRTTEAYGFGMLRNPSFCFAFVPGEGALTPRQPPVRGVHLDHQAGREQPLCAKKYSGGAPPPAPPPACDFFFRRRAVCFAEHELCFYAGVLKKANRALSFCLEPNFLSLVLCILAA